MIQRSLTLLFLVLYSLALFSCKQDQDKWTLFLTGKDIEKLRQSTDPAHFQHQYFQDLKQYTDANIARGVDVPDRGGNWYHYYVDPEEGQRLITGKQIGPYRWEHYKADCTQIYRGNPDIPAHDYDGVVISSRYHGLYSNMVFAAALMYRLTDEQSYLEYIKEVMDAYCEKYPTYPYRNTKHQPDLVSGTGAGKVTVQALDESVWLIRILQGLDLVWEELDRSMKQSIEDNILSLAMKSITSNKRGVHNIQCWCNAAIGLTGYLTENDTLIQLAINDPENGFNRNLRDGLTPEGFWYERSPSYHFYAIEPIHFLAEAINNQGDQDFPPKIKKIFDAPLLFSPPNGDMPRLNDARPIYLPNFKRLYFYAYSRFKDPSYLKILEAESPRKDVIFNYEWFFSEETYESKPLVLDCETTSYPGTGYDILVRDDLWTLFKYDNHTGGHAHPDALSFVTWYNGAYTAIDPGIAEYGALAHGNWYKRTLSHNTLTVNGEDQLLKGGTLLNTGTAGEVPFSQVRANGIYPGVEFYRSICLPSTSMILISDVIRADEPKDLELAYHSRGNFLDDYGGTDVVLQDTFPYRFIDNPRLIMPNHAFRLGLNNPDSEAQQKIIILSDQEAELIYGSGPGYDFEETPLALLRYTGTQWSVVWLINYGDTPCDVKMMGNNIEIFSEEDHSTIANLVIDPIKGTFEVL